MSGLERKSFTRQNSPDSLTFSYGKNIVRGQQEVLIERCTYPAMCLGYCVSVCEGYGFVQKGGQT